MKQTFTTPNSELFNLAPSMRLPNRGFTLIEILVVMFIVTIMAGITVANMPQFARTADIDTESRRLVVLLDMARDEALLQSKEIGFKPKADGYEFLEFDELSRTWSPLVDRPFQARTLEAGLQLELNVEAQSVPLGDDEDEIPPVLLLSSGETTVFELTMTFEAEQTSRTLVGDGINRITIADNDETQ